MFDLNCVSSLEVVRLLLAILINLLLLSLSLLASIHCLISDIHCSSWLRVELVDTGSPWSNDRYNWVSLAYRWNDRTDLQAMCPRGRVYIVKKMGPSTEPCGTPQVRGLGLELEPKGEMY